MANDPPNVFCIYRFDQRRHFYLLQQFRMLLLVDSFSAAAAVAAAAPETNDAQVLYTVRWQTMHDIEIDFECSVVGTIVSQPSQR